MSATQTATIRETAREALIQLAQEKWENEMSQNYHTLIAESDGTFYWSEKINDNECGEAEYFNRKRDYWSLQTVGLGSCGHGGADADYYETRKLTAEEFAVVNKVIADELADDFTLESIMREKRSEGVALACGYKAFPNDNHAGHGENGWYVQTDNLLHWTDACQSVDAEEMMSAALEKFDAIPVGFFAGEEASEEWENLKD